MQYVPCDSESNKTYRTYCCYNYDCFRIFQKDARCREYFDKRDGTTCNTVVSECPC